jgi:hypothetical protein
MERLCHWPSGNDIDITDIINGNLGSGSYQLSTPRDQAYFWPIIVYYTPACDI